MKPHLFIFGGLPGTGKTTVARELARQTRAVYLRIDTLEQALVNSGLAAMEEIGGSGYQAAQALAADNLQLGMDVVADCVNPLRVTREAWRQAAWKADAHCVEIELTCSDLAEHQSRVEQRKSDIPHLKLPDWQAVQAREYEPWDEPAPLSNPSQAPLSSTSQNHTFLRFDTATLSPGTVTQNILAHF